MRRLPALLAGLVVALLATSAAGADPAAPFDFGGTGTLQVVPGMPTSTELCNGTGAAVTAQLSTEGFAFSLVPGATAPVLTDPTATIPAGSCSAIKVAVAAGALLAGSYDGTLVAASIDGVARRAVTIAAAPGALAGVVTDITLAARHDPFREHSTLIGAASIPLGPYAPNTSIVVPPGTTAILQNGSHLAYLKVKGGVTKLEVNPRGFANLPVDIDGASKTGTYKGVIALGTSKVNVSVAVGDSIWFCILAISAGIALALGAAIFSLRWYPGHRLRVVRKNLLKDQQAAVTSYNGAAAEDNLPRLGIDPDKTGAYGAKVIAAWNRYKRRTVIVDSESPDYKAIRALVDGAENDRSYLSGSDGLVEALSNLKKALDGFTAPAGNEPLFRSAAAKLLDPQNLGPGDATTLGASAAAYTDLLGHWPTLWRLLGEYESWLFALAARVPEDDLQLLQRPMATLAEIAYELVAVDSVEAFDHARVEADFTQAYEELSALGWIYHPVAPGEVAPGGRTSPAVELYAAKLSLAGGKPDLQAAATHIAQPALHVVDAARRAITAPQELHTAVENLAGRVSRPASYGIVAALALSGSLSTGLTTIYSDTFGSLGNYLTAFGLGSAAGIASKAILDSITAMRKVEP